MSDLDDIKLVLRDIVLREVLRGRHPAPLDDGAALVTSGLVDSLKLVALVSRVRARLGVSIDLRAAPLRELDTLDALARYVHARRVGGSIDE